MLPAFLTRLCLSLPHAFISGALQVQKTAAVFFLLHVCVHRVRLNSCHLGLGPPALARLETVACAPSQGHDAQVRAVTGVRCPACGFAKRSGAAMIAHIKREHLFPDGRPRRRHFVEAMFRRDHVTRPERYFTSPRSVPVAEADVVEPSTCIAMRQVRQGSDAVNSIWEVERFLHLFQTLLDYADFPPVHASAQGHLPGVPDVVRWFFHSHGQP